MRSGSKSSGVASRIYNLAYKLGYTPWDQGQPVELVELIEGEHALSPGRAIDLGCGTASKAIYLAQHGWTVTGVDKSPDAVKEARAKVAESGLPVEVAQCDLVELDAEGVQNVAGAPFDFLLDFGCAHSLRDAAKAKYAANIARLAAPEATLFLYAFTKSPWRVTREDIDTAFAPYWKLVSATPGALRGKPDAGPMWYRMTRRR
jgi:SAM-dependent methyltransferase